MAFILNSGRVKRVFMPVTASTVLAANSLVTMTSGKLVAVTASTAALLIEGVLEGAIAAADADYASERTVSVLVPTEKNTIWEGDVTSGLVATDTGTEVDLTDASTVNRAAGSVDIVKVRGVISTTKGLFNLKINGSY